METWMELKLAPYFDFFLSFWDVKNYQVSENFLSEVSKFNHGNLSLKIKQFVLKANQGHKTLIKSYKNRAKQFQCLRLESR